MVAPNPFTPRSGLEPKNFVGREAEKKYFEKALNELLTGQAKPFLSAWELGNRKNQLAQRIQENSPGERRFKFIYLSEKVQEFRRYGGGNRKPILIFGLNLKIKNSIMMMLPKHLMMIK